MTPAQHFLSSEPMYRSQPDNNATIQDLVTWIASREDRGMRGADAGDVPFVSYTALQEYFSGYRRIEQLLEILFDSSDLSLDYLDAKDIRDQYARVFCVLILIGQGRFISRFVELGINDRRLPLRLQERDGFPRSTSDPNFFDNFYKEQWQFCVEDLSVTLNRTYQPESILPIWRKRRLGEGGSATTYLVEVHGSYNSLEPVSTSFGEVIIIRTDHPY